MYNDAADQTLFHCYIDANNYLHLFYDAGTDQFHYTVVWGSTSTTLTSTSYSSDAALQVIQNIRINHDSEGNKISLEISAQAEDADTNTGTPSTSNPTKATVGAQQDRSTPGDYILLDIQSFNSPINCFGAFFTGNSGTTQLDDGMYHKDITYFNSDGSTLDIGVTSYSTVAGNIDANEGSISLWFDSDDYSADTDLFGASSTMMIEWDDSDDDILFTYGSVSIRTTSTLSSGDNHIKVTWEASGEITLERNGVAETAVSASTAPSLDASFTIDSNITDIYITSDKGTPQIPCAGKIALDIPIVRND